MLTDTNIVDSQWRQTITVITVKDKQASKLIQSDTIKRKQRTQNKLNVSRKKRNSLNRLTTNLSATRNQSVPCI